MTEEVRPQDDLMPCPNILLILSSSPFRAEVLKSLVLNIHTCLYV